MFTPILANTGSPIVIIAICFIALLLFGHKLPSLARGLGSSVKEFKKGIKEGEEETSGTPEKKDDDKK